MIISKYSSLPLPWSLLFWLFSSCCSFFMSEKGKCESLSHVQLFVTPWTAALQASLSFTISQSLLKLMSIESVMPSNHLSSVIPFSSCLQSFPHQGHFQWVSTSPQVAKVLELQPQHQSFQWIFKIIFLYYWLVWFPSNPRDSQESSPTPQFKSINSLVLSFV